MEWVIYYSEKLDADERSLKSMRSRTSSPSRPRNASSPSAAQMLRSSPKLAGLPTPIRASDPTLYQSMDGEVRRLESKSSAAVWTLIGGLVLGTAGMGLMVYEGTRDEIGLTRMGLYGGAGVAFLLGGMLGSWALRPGRIDFMRVMNKHMRGHPLLVLRHLRLAAAYFVPNLDRLAAVCRGEGRYAEALRANLYALLFRPTLLARPRFLASCAASLLGVPSRRRTT